MSFTPEDQAFIRETARALVESIDYDAIVTRVIERAIPRAIEVHVQTCRWGRQMTRAFYVALGAALVGGGGFGALVMKFISTVRG